MRTIEDCKTLKYKVKYLVSNKMLMFIRNSSRVDILINRSCNAQSKRSQTPVVIPYLSISKINDLVLNIPVVRIRKSRVESSNKGKNSKYGKGKSSGVYPHVMVSISTLLRFHISKEDLLFLPKAIGTNTEDIHKEYWKDNMLQYLIQNSLKVPKSLKSFPLRFDPNMKCEYHNGSIGHSIKDCKIFKGKWGSWWNANA